MSVAEIRRRGTALHALQPSLATPYYVQLQGEEEPEEPNVAAVCLSSCRGQHTDCETKMYAYIINFHATGSENVCVSRIKRYSCFCAYSFNCFINFAALPAFVLALALA